MAEHDDNSKQDTPQDDVEGPRAGERLAEARRAQQISVHEIAKELHLDEQKVGALERNDFDFLGAPVFAKGHLKKYAELVGVDEADVLTDYYKLTRSAEIPPVVSSRQRPKNEMAPGPWIAVIVVIVIVASAYWWFTSRPVVTASPEPDAAPESVVEEPAVELPREPEDTAPAEVDTPQTSQPEPEAAPVDEAPQTVDAAPALPEGQVRLLVTYTGDCWTEVTDASGRRLFFDLGRDGRTVELTGVAPLNALFGNADNVRLEVNGSEHAIDPTERRGRTARMTIAAP